LTSSQLAG